MCGICGYVGIDQAGLIERMTQVINHRGPDDSGHFHDGDVSLGHRRLSIIDLAGRPSADGDAGRRYGHLLQW